MLPSTIAALARGSLDLIDQASVDQASFGHEAR